MLAGSAYGPSPYPLAELARPLWVGMWPVNLAGVTVLLLVFPDGRLRDRLVARRPGRLRRWDGSHDSELLGRPGGRQSRRRWTGRHLVRRNRTAGRPDDRGLSRRGRDLRRRAISPRESGPSQIRYLMFAAVVTVACLMLGWVVLALGAPLPLAFTPLLVGVVILLPLAVGVAIVRHDLFDIDRMFSATTTWGLTLIVSAAVYAVVVFGASRALGADLGVAPTIAAFVTALILLPLQRYLSAATGRVVDHDRFVAASLVERFTDDVRAGLRAPEEIEVVLREAQRDPGLSLPLSPTGRFVDGSARSPGRSSRRAGRAGARGVIARISLGYDSARARRRVADLARVGRVPIEVSRLRRGLRDALSETEAARERVAEASAVERRRPERDMHDGVQPRLVATGMRLRSLQRHLDPAQSIEIDAAVAELEATVAELRHSPMGSARVVSTTGSMPLSPRCAPTARFPSA